MSIQMGREMSNNTFKSNSSLSVDIRSKLLFSAIEDRIIGAEMIVPISSPFISLSI